MTNSTFVFMAVSFALMIVFRRVIRKNGWNRDIVYSFLGFTQWFVGIVLVLCILARILLWYGGK